MLSLALSFLCLVSALTNADAFVSPAASSSATNFDRDPSLNDLLDGFNVFRTAYQVKQAADLVGKDRSGNEIRVPVTDIERNWEFEGFTGTGEFSADLFVPDNGEVKGCAFFMHGFSQYPVAYYEMLKESCETAKVAIIAVETGLTSEGVFDEAMKDRKNSQLVLQRAVSEDTKQCIRMLKDGAFADYGVTKSAVGDKIAVMGHSMGGGLSFPVSADCDIDYVFTMAPAFGVEQFNPVTAVRKRTPKESMLLAGGWDLIARAKKVKEISAAADYKINNSSILVDIKRGLHTGFEDELVLFSVPLNTILKGFNLITYFFGIFDWAIFKVAGIIGFLRTKTGQIEGSTVLMSYFLSQMADGKSITAADAEQYLDDNIKDKFEEKFVFSYGGKED